MLKIVHICQDEKFINSGYYQFEKLYPAQNEFYVYRTKKEDVKHIKLNESFHFFEPSQAFFESLTNSIIVFHSIPDTLIDYLAFINESNKTVWFLFGFETYGDPLLYSENLLLDELTYKYFKTPTYDFGIKEDIKYYIFPFLRLFKKDLYITKKEWQKINHNKKLKHLQRIDYLGTSFEEEKKAQSKMLGFDRPLFHYWYYPLEVIIDAKIKINLTKTKMIIGHSGFSNGNHLDVINKIKDFRLEDQEIIIPFSYGNQHYIDLVKEEILALKNDVNFLEDFMSLDVYTALLNDVKIAIFNNRRQQAIGNIISLIYLGAKVFISEKNTFYQFLKRQNVIVFSYEDELNEDSAQNQLDAKEMFFNQQKMIELFSEEKLLSELKLSIEKIKNAK